MNLMHDRMFLITQFMTGGTKLDEMEYYIEEYIMFPVKNIV